MEVIDLKSIPDNFEFPNFRMNPETEDLYFGSDLEPGMVVLLEDAMLRGDPEKLQQKGLHPYEVNRIRDTARWCRITKLHKSYTSEIITFIGVYSDGTKVSRRYNDAYFWYVKI